jgi:thiamine kinase-like enzyme
MERLGLPKTIVHGDINYGNILFHCGRCQFIDWCEAYVANPLISLQHLLLLNKTEDPELRSFMNQGIMDRYRTIWLGSCNADSFDQGLTYMPLLAVASTLYGRGDWLASPLQNDLRQQSYARSLARYMDHAAREPKLLEALCH